MAESKKDTETDAEAVEGEVVLDQEAKEKETLSKLKKGDYTPTRSVCCKDGIVSKGQKITADMVKGGKSAFDTLVKKKRVFKA